MIVVVEFGWMVEVDIGEVWENVPEIFYHIGGFICERYFNLVVTETGAALLNWFPAYWPPQQNINNLRIVQYLNFYRIPNSLLGRSLVCSGGGYLIVGIYVSFLVVWKVVVGLGVYLCVWDWGEVYN